MQMKVPVIVKDLRTQEWKGFDPKDGIEDVTIDSEAYFLDGPVSPRVAVLDFDDATGAVVPVKLAAGGKAYEHGPPPTQADPIASREFLSVSVFGTVHKVLELFEVKDTLGRKLDWAFDGPQLLVVPRAGEMANAFYERESRSLQFFYFQDEERNRRVYAAASQDIVAHETGHAVLDAIAPDLYDAMTPQSLAMHEAIADLVALHCSLTYRPLADKVLSDMGGDLGKASSTAFSVLALELGDGRDLAAQYLRNLADKHALAPRAGYHVVASTKPHDLSTVLSGALYCVLLQAYRAARTELAKRPSPRHQQMMEAFRRRDGASPDEGLWRVALYLATHRFKRFVFRALDYLPPGDATWIDLARAMLASDAAYHPEVDELRTGFVDELIARGVGKRKEIEAKPLERVDVRDMDLATMLASDWAAYDWVSAHRKELGIPKGIPFEVRPRLDVTKHVYHRDRDNEDARELVIKVAWDRVEDNTDLAVAARRRVRCGTTLAVRWANKPRVIAHVTSHDSVQTRASRDELLVRLESEGKLRNARGASSRRMNMGLLADVADDVMTLSGGARLLHIVEDDHD